MAAHYHQGRFTPKNPQKYEGDLSNIIYRSSWELKFFLWCDGNPNVIKYSSEEVIVPYIKPTDGKVHRYFVDAKITVKDINGNLKTYLIEIKPHSQTKPPTIKKKKTKSYIDSVITWSINEAKWEAAKKYADKKGYEFKILTEHELKM